MYISYNYYLLCYPLAIDYFTAKNTMASDTVKSLGKRIRQLRTNRGFTQSELAEQCELSDNFIAMLERGKNSPSIFTLEKLARALRVSLAELFSFDKTSDKSFTLPRDKREKAIRKLLKAKSDKDVQLIAKIVELTWRNKKRSA